MGKWQMNMNYIRAFLNSHTLNKELDVLLFSCRESTENDGYKFNYQVFVDLQSRN